MKMKIKTFDDFINESLNRTSWEKMEFPSHGEKEVADVAEETLLTKHLVVIHETDDLYDKISQLAASQEAEPVLEVSKHTLSLYSTPFEFLSWVVIGSTPEDILERNFVLRTEDLKKV
jgi:hypothetical protein